MPKVILFLSSFALIALFTLCRKDVGKPGFGNYPNEIGKIFVYQCATSGCHNDASYEAAAGLNLSTWENLFKGSNSGSPVIPFSSEFSSLCYFINTYPELGPINIPTMPYNKDPLSYEQVQMIKNWINEGAPDADGNIKWSENSKRKKIYVTNQGCDVVTVFDSETMLPMRVVKVGNDNANIEVPHIVKVSPDGEFWYVIFVANHIIQKYRCSDDVLVGTADLGASTSGWNIFTISDNGKKGYASTLTDGRVASIDLDQMKVINSFPGYMQPHGISLSPDNSTLYITAQNGNFIYKVDTGFSTTASQITLNGLPPSTVPSLDPHEIILSPDQQKLFITCQGTNELRVLDIATETVSNIIATGTFPLEMAISKSKNQLFVTCMEDTSTPGTHGVISVINISSLTEFKRIPVGFMPHGIGIDESKKMIYVASRNILSSGPAPHHSAICSGRNGFVNYIDLNSLQVQKRKTEISIDPYSIAVRK